MSKSIDIADLIKTVEIHAAAQRQIVDLEKGEHGAQDALADLIERSKGLLVDESPIGKRIKSRGIALVHSAQGGPANNRPESLLVKSKEIQKGKRRVQVEISKAGVTVLTPEQEANLKGLLATLKMEGTN